MSKTASRVQADTSSMEDGLGECDRKELIASIVALVRDGQLPADAHEAALTLIGWLARRRSGERPCNRGVYEARKQHLSIHGSQR